MTTKTLVFQKKKAVHKNFREVEWRAGSDRPAAEHIWPPSIEKTQRTLQTRALALAQEPSAQEALDEGIQIVEFILGHERYALESRFVTQVACLQNIVPVPCTPAFVRGIVSVRGEILPVIDLKKFLELPEKELSDLSTLIVLHSAETTFSILADEIVSVRRIFAADIQPSLPTLTGIRKNYLKGVTSEPLVVLDAAKLLMDESLIVEEQVGE
jgi:purine-binding chemotaxis protein CheW